MSKVIKPSSLENATPSRPGNLYGLTSTAGKRLVSLGDQALLLSSGLRNVAIGYNSQGSSSELSYDNVTVGSFAGAFNADGIENVAIGSYSLDNTPGTQGGNSYNVAVGMNTLSDAKNSRYCTVIGWRAHQGGGDTELIEGNTAVGAKTLEFSRGSYNTGVGYEAGTYQQNGNLVGSLTNFTAIGRGSRVGGSNQVQIGNSSTSFYAYGAYNNRSDIRDKADVRDTSLGLEFINKIRPVEFKWDYREDYQEAVEIENEDGTKTITYVQQEKDGSKTRNRYHQGVIAQEVKSVMDDLGIDFAGYQDHSVNGGNDVLTIGYTEFISPLIKAIQELTARVEALEAK